MGFDNIILLKPGLTNLLIFAIDDTSIIYLSNSYFSFKPVLPFGLSAFDLSIASANTCCVNSHRTVGVTVAFNGKYVALERPDGYGCSLLIHIGLHNIVPPLFKLAARTYSLSNHFNYKAYKNANIPAAFYSLLKATSITLPVLKPNSDAMFSQFNTFECSCYCKPDSLAKCCKPSGIGIPGCYPERNCTPIDFNTCRVHKTKIKSGWPYAIHYSVM